MWLFSCLLNPLVITYIYRKCKYTTDYPALVIPNYLFCQIKRGLAIIIQQYNKQFKYKKYKLSLLIFYLQNYELCENYTEAIMSVAKNQ